MHGIYESLMELVCHYLFIFCVIKPVVCLATVLNDKKSYLRKEASGSKSGMSLEVTTICFNAYLRQLN